MRVAAFFHTLPRDRPLLGIAAGIAFFILTSTMHWMLGEVSEGFGPMALLPSILLAGLFGGIGVGIGFAGMCTLVAWVFFFPPYGTFILATGHKITMGVFMVTAALELYVVRTLNIAIYKLSEAREHANTLFRELQHRVANNLQFVAALLNARKKSVSSGSGAVEALGAAEQRLEMMSRVHRRLHDPTSVDLPVGDYLYALCTDLIWASDTPAVELVVDARPLVFTLDRLMSVSLIVAELVTNSLKHAFDGRSEGRITIELSGSGERCILKVADDGPGLPPDFDHPAGTRLGQGILQSLAGQLHGHISFSRGPGAVATLSFRQ